MARTVIRDPVHPRLPWLPHIAVGRAGLGAASASRAVIWCRAEVSAATTRGWEACAAYPALIAATGSPTARISANSTVHQVWIRSVRRRSGLAPWPDV
ncbi:hypothetical protein [Streptomyces antioxidans]|uniref:hypothetical protein n=1 Tax=Streptomyces antioxidans TaxID=1507734 RepID=UPI00061485F8|nr:hypothetical protein [Streptomyces antioxidans]